MKTAGIALSLGLLAALAAALPPPEDLKPGAKDAIEKAVEQAVEWAVVEAVGSLPEGVDSFAVVPLANDDNGVFTDRVQYHAVKKTVGNARVVNRDDAKWNMLLKEFEFSEKRFDIMQKDEVREFGKILGADALLYGVVRDHGLDDTGLRGRASLTLYLGMVETGQIAGTGSGKGDVAIEAETFILGLTQQSWFWPVVVIAAVGFFIFLGIWIPMRRKIALATKPREIVR